MMHSKFFIFILLVELYCQCSVFNFPCSTSVNGNGSVHAGYCTEETPAPPAIPTAAKETKVKASFI